MIDEERQPDDLENEPFVMPEYVDEAELPPLTVTPEEPILTALLRESLSMNRAGDAMMNDFAEWVLPQIVRGLTGTSAKGGDFALEKAAAGSDTERYQYDQSLRAHILNGLFAMLRIYDAGQQWGSTATDDMGDYGRRLIIAGYILHDYNKMPDVKEALRRQFDTEQVTPSAAAMPTLYRIIREQAAAFNLPEFFQAGGYELSPHDLIYVIHNTQGMWGTIPEYLLEGSVTDTRTVGDAREFTQIADLLAYGTFLEAGTLHKINIILGRLDMPFKLSAHRITQVTGIVTAYLHNAVVAALTDAGHVPILFAPNGVIYASPKNTPVPDLQQVARQASLAVQQAAMDGIERLAGTAFAVGIAWGTQGLKTAPFIDALYTPDRVLALVWKRLSPRLLDMQPRKREQLKVYKKLESGLKEGWQWFMADRIAELTAFMDERAEALADWLAYAYAMDARSESNNTEIILNSLDFDIGAETDLITTAQKGGVQFWPYLLALRYIQRNPTLAPQEVDMLVNRIIDDVLAPRFTAPESTELSQHVEQHAAQVVLLPRHGMEDEDRERFRREIAAYAIAKTDNKRGAYDTLYNIPFGVEQQQEATLPYMPTPYSQRLPLGSSDALGGWRRGISGVGVANMLLMQTALRQPFQFEDRKGKWLYLYPVYYFTPETGDALLGLTQRLQYFDLNEWLKHTEYGLKVDGQTVGAFGTLMQKPSSYAPPVQALRYGSNHTPTLLQIAVDHGAADRVGGGCEGGGERKPVAAVRFRRRVYADRAAGCPTRRDCRPDRTRDQHRSCAANLAPLYDCGGDSARCVWLRPAAVRPYHQRALD
jgi:CRISPR-associated protein Csc3